MRSINRYFVVIGLFFAACGKGPVYSEFRPLSDGIWNKDSVMEFQLTDLDTSQIFQMYINVRNDNAYPYSNLFLITSLENPAGETVIDTLEYEMAKPNGEWMGKGYGSIKENKLWYKENIDFPVKGVYKVRIQHAMRKNGTIEGIVELPGIIDVGVEIEKQ